MHTPAAAAATSAARPCRKAGFFTLMRRAGRLHAPPRGLSACTQPPASAAAAASAAPHHPATLRLRAASLIASCSRFSEAELMAGAVQADTLIRHKYAESVPVRIKIEMGGALAWGRVLCLCCGCLHRAAGSSAASSAASSGAAWAVCCAVLDPPAKKISCSKQAAACSFAPVLPADGLHALLPRPCCAAPAGTDDQRLLVVKMHRLAETAAMAAFDAKGRVIYANTPLASMLGYQLRALRDKDISQLLPPPYGTLHLRWIKVASGAAAQGACAAFAALHAWRDGCGRMQMRTCLRDGRARTRAAAARATPCRRPARSRPTARRAAAATASPASCCHQTARPCTCARPSARTWTPPQPR